MRVKTKIYITGTFNDKLYDKFKEALLNTINEVDTEIAPLIEPISINIVKSLPKTDIIDYFREKYHQLKSGMPGPNISLSFPYRKKILKKALLGKLYIHGVSKEGKKYIAINSKFGPLVMYEPRATINGVEPNQVCCSLDPDQPIQSDYPGRFNLNLRSLTLENMQYLFEDNKWLFKVNK